ncbi:MAG TPA: hypothetical protein VJG83_01710 [archaeon]|nr:hypothetical protein [archaeon]
MADLSEKDKNKKMVLDDYFAKIDKSMNLADAAAALYGKFRHLGFTYTQIHAWLKTESKPKSRHKVDRRGGAHNIAQITVEQATGKILKIMSGRSISEADFISRVESAMRKKVLPQTIMHAARRLNATLKKPVIIIRDGVPLRNVKLEVKRGLAAFGKTRPELDIGKRTFNVHHR